MNGTHTQLSLKKVTGDPIFTINPAVVGPSDEPLEIEDAEDAPQNAVNPDNTDNTVD